MLTHALATNQPAIYFLFHLLSFGSNDQLNTKLKREKSVFMTKDMQFGHDNVFRRKIRILLDSRREISEKLFVLNVSSHERICLEASNRMLENLVYKILPKIFFSFVKLLN
jgi:hypothetical protein